MLGKYKNKGRYSVALHAFLEQDTEGFLNNMNPSDESATLKDDISRRLNQSILTGRYAPGTILNEKALIDEYSVSKSPIREALLELCYEGVLRSIPRYGYEVLRLTEEDERSVREYRQILESCSLASYWDRLKEESLQKLQSWVRAQDNRSEQALDQWRCDMRFHLELNACLHNEYTYLKLEEALLIQTRAYAQFNRERWYKDPYFSTKKDHEQILTLILQGEQQAAVESLRQDISVFPFDLQMAQ